MLIRLCVKQRERARESDIFSLSNGCSDWGPRALKVFNWEKNADRQRARESGYFFVLPKGLL